MWSKVAKLASPAPRRTPAPAQSPKPADTALIFSQLDAALAGSTPPRGPDETRELVARLLVQLLAALKAGSGGAAGALDEGTEHLLQSNALSALVEQVEGDPALREELVRWYARAVIELDEAWLSHGTVNKPLVRLLRRCVDEEGGLGRDEELAVVRVMCIVAERIKTRPELLAIFFREKGPRLGKKDVSTSIAAAMNRRVPFASTSAALDDPPASPTLSQATMSDASAPFGTSQASSTASPRRRAEHDFLLFSYLLRFIHREGEIGDSAREGVLSLVDVALGYPSLYNPSLGMHRTSSASTVSPATVLTPSAPPAAAREAVLAFAEYLLDSDFAEVLGAGLGALYGLLPSKLVVRSADTTGTADAGGTTGSLAGAMVLGGMGALHDEEDAEEAQRLREEEELRLRGEGYGLTGTTDFSEGLDGFLKLVEFAQDVLRRSTDGGVSEDDSDEARQQHLVMVALTSAILDAIRDLFLRSVLYPSVLECSETDGSAVAVLTYLDAMVGVVQEGSKLEAAVLGYLFAEDDRTAAGAAARSSRPSVGSNASPPASSSLLSPASQVKRRKSSALLLIERASSHDASDYYSASGRFSLRDLLVSNVSSPAPATATAALKLLKTLLAKHDRWSTALLDPILDEAATSFPIALRAPPPALIDDDDDSDDDDAPFVYPTPAPESNSEDFAYPSVEPATPRASRPSAFAKTPAAALRPLLGMPLPSTPTSSLHRDSLDTLLSLVGSIDPSYRRSRAMGSGSEIVTTGFANYLRDAEANLAGELGFRRGLGAPPADAREAAEPPSHVLPQARRRSTLFGPSAPSLTGRDFARAKTGYRHKLKPNAKIVALLLDSLAHFFSHSPDLNLTLTAVLATLALSPYRSLDSWLLPVVKAVKLEEPFASPRARSGAGSPRSDDGDDRSDDFEVDERSRHAALLSPHPSSPFPSSGSAPPSATRAALATSDSLLSILDALAQSVEKYRRAIPRFDEFLTERRQGLFFADNLADALEGDELGSALDENAFGPPQQPTAPAPAQPAPKQAPSSSFGLGSFFSPRKSGHKRSPSSPTAFQTPTRPGQVRRPSQLRRSASDESLAPLSPSRIVPPTTAQGLAPPAAAQQQQGPASPFAAHYRQTGAITVQPVVVATPASIARSAARGASDAGEEDEDEDERPPDSPTRRLSFAPGRSSSPSARSSASSSALSDRQRAGYGSSSGKARPPPVVSLSMVLDNVIVLEEFVKELAAIVYVRRAVGIDAVQFVE
ncbi:hypothetical protein Rhopal_005230-T1 [Rhodotorula paludigena]|uniref:FHF complex subunit HOOK-interacting protein C-terminal domain-containing protein n=1 Tax=Rhodotorula paludigena TaxID=86838 RepID=A0AAV5GQN5_9BASI|nr:hypothetical protein Rhopal_005230-T1 [Rhodotorula paludigena]